jgi:hypothetical protein
LNSDLGRVAKWSTRNCLVLNPSKTKYMIFGTDKQLDKIKPKLSIKINEEKLERVFVARNLGLVMDCSCAMKSM